MSATTQAEIRQWFIRGVAEGHTHLMVRCDTFDHDDYPVYRDSAEEARKLADDTSNMQSTHEVYNLKADMESQLAERRSFNY